MKTHIITTDSCCPHCQYKFDRASSLTGEEGPKPGDLTVCFKCERICTFTDTLGNVREATPLEIESAMHVLSDVIAELKTVKRASR